MVLHKYPSNNTKLLSIITSYTSQILINKLTFKLSIQLSTYQKSIKKYIFAILTLYFMVFCNTYIKIFVSINRNKIHSKLKNHDNLYHYLIKGFISEYMIKWVFLKNINPFIFTKSTDDVLRSNLTNNGIQSIKVLNINIYGYRYNHQLTRFTNRLIKHITLIFTLIITISPVNYINNYLLNALRSYLFRMY